VVNIAKSGVLLVANYFQMEPSTETVLQSA
jgi:hypothetical protein